LIRNRQKDDPDLHQDDDEKGILDPVPFDTGLEQARMTTTDDFTVIPEFNSGQALNLIQDRLQMILAFVRMTTTDDFTVILNLIQDRLQMILAFVRMTTNVANVS